MVETIVENAGSLGVGCVLALIIFVMYRIDRKATEDRLTKLLKDDQESRKEHTQALAELTSYLRGQNGRNCK